MGINGLDEVNTAQVRVEGALYPGENHAAGAADFRWVAVGPDVDSLDVYVTANTIDLAIESADTGRNNEPIGGPVNDSVTREIVALAGGNEEFSDPVLSFPVSETPSQFSVTLQEKDEISTLDILVGDGEALRGIIALANPESGEVVAWSPIKVFSGVSVD